MKPRTNEIERNAVYRYQDGIYVNLTNRCPTACRFCVKFVWKMKYRDYDLKLRGKEPTVNEVMLSLDRARKQRPFREAVFCGYGESTYRLAEMIEICGEIERRYPGVARRLNTIGLGNLIHRRSIAPEMAGRLTAVSVSLNTADPDRWVEIMNPIPEFKAEGYASVLKFIRDCSQAIPDTTVTAVDQPGVDIEACRRLARSLGAKFRERPRLSDYEAAETR